MGDLGESHSQWHLPEITGLFRKEIKWEESLVMLIRTEKKAKE